MAKLFVVKIKLAPPPDRHTGATLTYHVAADDSDLHPGVSVTAKAIARAKSSMLVVRERFTVISGRWSAVLVHDGIAEVPA